MRCEEAVQKIGAMIDGELSPELRERLETHLARCEPCRAVTEDHRAIKQSVRKLLRSEPPATLPWRIHKSLTSVDRRRAHLRQAVSSAAAAMLIGILLFMTSRADVLPPLLAQTAELHEKLDRIPLRSPEEIQKHLNREIAVPAPGESARLKGGCCCCCNSEGPMIQPSPCLVYQKGDVMVSLVVTPQKLESLPESNRRNFNGMDCFVFTRGSLGIILCQTRTETHIWMGRLPMPELMEFVHSTRSMKSKLNDGYRFRLEGVSCQACSAAIRNALQKLGGVQDIAFDLSRREMIVSLDTSKTTPEDIVRAVKLAGFTAIR